jgi:hypothetical protein
MGIVSLFWGAASNCHAVLDCFCPVQVRTCLIFRPPLLNSLLTLPRIYPPPPPDNRSLPSSPAHNYTVSFLSRLSACSSTAAACTEQFCAAAESLPGFIYPVLLGVRFGVGALSGASRSGMAPPTSLEPGTSATAISRARTTAAVGSGRSGFIARRTGGAVVHSAPSRRVPRTADVSLRSFPFCLYLPSLYAQEQHVHIPFLFLGKTRSLLR